MCAFLKARWARSSTLTLFSRSASAVRPAEGCLMANKKGRRRSFGSVRQLASGRWQVRYRDPETGLLRPAEKTYETKTHAQVALTHIEADITRGQWADPDAGAVNFADYATAWLRDRK